MSQKIVPHLWFDKEAKEAAEFYVSIFPNSIVTRLTTIYDTPSGDCDIVAFELSGYEFMAISAGPLFQINPSISFSAFFKTKEEVDRLWDKLIDEGKALMEIGAYSWSDRYGWIQDRYGVTWQIMRVDEVVQPIVPHLMFTRDMYGRAEEAMWFYTSVFTDAKLGDIFRYGTEQKPEKDGNIAHAWLTLEGQQFSIAESVQEHEFTFNEAVSFIVKCDTQEEIDLYWEKLSAVPEAEQCGWLKDKYGVSWQIVPRVMDEMMGSDDPEKIARVTQAFLKMKKFDLAELERAAKG